MPDVTVRLSVADEFSGNLKKFATETGNASDSAKDFSNNTKQSKLSLTDLKSGLDLAIGAFRQAEAVYNEVIGGTVEYAKQVRDLSRAIGASTEDASKLIQAADDVGVSYETLTAALDAAVRKGLSPTIDGLGLLADQYNAIQDPIERTAFAMENFGRQGAELAPLLEQGSVNIRLMGENAREAGLIMSGDAVQAAREYEIAVDDLGDSIDGLKYKIGNTLIPAINNLISTSDENIARSREIILAQYGIKDSFTASAEATNTWGAGYAALAAAMGQTTPQIAAQIVPVKELSASTLELAGSIQEVMDKQDAWAEKAGGDFKSALVEAGVQGSELTQALMAVDAVMGTSLLQQEQYEKSVKEITDQFAKTGDIQAFMKSLNELKAQMQPQIARNDEYFLSLTRIRQELSNLTKSQWNIVTNFITNGSPPAGVSVPAPAPAGARNQYGADFTVPAGYPNDTFPMRVSSGERVTVTPQFGGGPAASSGGVNATFYITEAANPEATARMVVQYLEDLDRARKG